MAECSLAKTMGQIEPAVADALQQWSDTGLSLDGRVVSAQRVSDCLKQDGMHVRVQTVRAHRRRACVCFQTGSD